jgi:hypothetical protein
MSSAGSLDWSLHGSDYGEETWHYPYCRRDLQCQCENLDLEEQAFQLEKEGHSPQCRKISHMFVPGIIHLANACSKCVQKVRPEQ